MKIGQNLSRTTTLTILIQTKPKQWSKHHISNQDFRLYSSIKYGQNALGICWQTCWTIQKIGFLLQDTCDLDVGTGISHHDDTLTDLADYFGGSMMLYTITLPLSTMMVCFILAFILVTGGDGLLFRICHEDKSKKEELQKGFRKSKWWLQATNIMTFDI